MKNVKRIIIVLLTVISLLNAGTFSRTYGLVDVNERATDVIQCADSNYIVIGTSSNDAIMIKTKRNGDLVWMKTYGDGNIFYPSKVKETSNNNLLICGGKTDTSDALWVMKTDHYGGTIWSKTFSGYKQGLDMIGTADSCFMITGRTDDNLAYLLKVDMNGNTVYANIYDEIYTAENDLSMATFPEGGYVILCNSTHKIFKVDQAGNVVWINSIELTEDSTDYERTSEICRLNETTYVVIGSRSYRLSVPPGFTEWHTSGVLVTLNLEGNLRSVNQYNSVYQFINRVPGGDLFLVGNNSDGLSGNYISVFFKDFWGKSISNLDYASCITVTNGGYFLVAGYNYEQNSKTDLSLMKIAYNGSWSNNFDWINFFPDYVLYQNYPNPFNSSTTLSYELPAPSGVQINIYDIIGRKIMHWPYQYQSSGSYQITWNGKDNSGNPVPSGVYIYRLVTENFVQSKKMVLLK